MAPKSITLKFERDSLKNAVKKLLAGRTDRRHIVDIGYIGLIVMKDQVTIVDRDRRIVVSGTATAEACVWLPAHVFADAKWEFKADQNELAFVICDGSCRTGWLSVDDPAIRIMEYSTDPRFEFGVVASANPGTFVPSTVPKPGMRDAYKLLRGVDEGYGFRAEDVEKLQVQLKKSIARFLDDTMAFKTTEADICSFLDWKVGLRKSPPSEV